MLLQKLLYLLRIVLVLQLLLHDLWIGEVGGGRVLRTITAFALLTRGESRQGFESLVLHTGWFYTRHSRGTRGAVRFGERIRGGFKVD